MQIKWKIEKEDYYLQTDERTLDQSESDTELKSRKDSNLFLIG